MIRSRPAPKTNNCTQTPQVGVDAASVVSQSIAAITIAEPAIGNALYRPDLLIAMPDQMEVPIRPAIIGSISSPETAAEVPADICRNVGMNASAANMPMPRVKPMAVLLMKIGLRNRLSGMIGSSARRSASTKAQAASSRPAPKSQVTGEAQP